MSWDEFRALLAGLSPDTALGRVVAIRAETDENMIKHFSADQKRIYEEWRNRRVRTMPQEEFAQEMRKLEQMFAAACG